MIIINKENYEMIMFDLLEGNIEEPQKSELINQINKDEFLKKEWKLMQHTMLTPELEMVYPDKDNLIKPVGNTKIFNLYFVSSIAASLLILAIFFVKFYKPETKSISQNSTSKPKTEKFEKIEKTHTNTTNTIEEVKKSKIAEIKIRTGNNGNKTQAKTNIDTASEIENSKSYEEIVVKGQNLEKIGYSTIYDEKIEESSKLNIEKYSYRRKTKYDGLVAGTHKIREVWDDLPNLKIKIKPKIKNYKPALDITLKGETIYAYTTIEIK